MFLQSRLIRCSALIALLWSGDNALAIQDSDKVLLGPISVGRGETVRINVYAYGDPDAAPDPELAPWDFVVRIFNREGKVVQEWKLPLAVGVTGFVDVSIQDEQDFPVDRLGRRSLRAEIVGFNPQPDPPGVYAATLEVVNQLTGRTSILLGGPDTVPLRDTLPAVQR